jgi:hypothetical protein
MSKMKITNLAMVVGAFAGLSLVGCEEGQGPTNPSADNRLSPPPGASLSTPKVNNDLSSDLIVAGSGIVADGIGLDGATTGTIVVDVPGGVSINRVLLYWEARGDDGDPSTVTVTKDAVSKNISGEFVGLSEIASGPDSRSYRADITSEFSFGSGINSVQVDVASGIDFNGASLVVVVDDGSAASLEIRDGDDFAYLGFPLGDPNRDTNAQTFAFPAAPSDRQANLWLIVGDVEDSRPNKIDITVAGVTQELVNALGDGGSGRDGPEWDTYSAMVSIPAGATQLTVQLFSFDDETDKNPASLAWIVAALTVPITEGGEGCTPGYWKQDHHFDSWTLPFEPETHFADVFEDAFPGMTLHQVLEQGGGGLIALGRHTVAALLNAASPGVAYDMSVADVIDAFNAVHPGDKHEYEDVKDMFEHFNQQGCPLN